MASILNAEGILVDDVTGLPVNSSQGISGFNASTTTVPSTSISSTGVGTDITNALEFGTSVGDTAVGAGTIPGSTPNTVPQVNNSGFGIGDAVDIAGAVASVGQLGLGIAQFGQQRKLNRENIRVLKQNRDFALEEQEATRAYRNAYNA